MAKSRKAKATVTPTAPNEPTTSTATPTATKERTTMSKVLDAATIQELLSKQKSRGDYDSELREFDTSGEAGIEVSLTEGRFAGKRAQNVKVGLDNARKRTTDAGLVHPHGPGFKVIAVVVDDKKDPNADISEERVFLINTAVVADATADDDEDAEVTA